MGSREKIRSTEAGRSVAGTAVRLRANAARLVALIALLAVAVGLGLAGFGRHHPANWLWAATTVMLLVPLTWS